MYRMGNIFLPYFVDSIVHFVYIMEQSPYNFIELMVGMYDSGVLIWLVGEMVTKKMKEMVLYKGFRLCIEVIYETT